MEKSYKKILLSRLIRKFYSEVQKLNHKKTAPLMYSNCLINLYFSTRLVVALKVAEPFKMDTFHILNQNVPISQKALILYLFYHL